MIISAFLASNKQQIQWTRNPHKKGANSSKYEVVNAMKSVQIV